MANEDKNLEGEKDVIAVMAKDFATEVLKSPRVKGVKVIVIVDSGDVEDGRLYESLHINNVKDAHALGAIVSRDLRDIADLSEAAFFQVEKDHGSLAVLHEECEDCKEKHASEGETGSGG